MIRNSLFVLRTQVINSSHASYDFGILLLKEHPNKTPPDKRKVSIHSRVIKHFVVNFILKLIPILTPRHVEKDTISFSTISCDWSLFICFRSACDLNGTGDL